MRIRRGNRVARALRRLVQKEVPVPMHCWIEVDSWQGGWSYCWVCGERWSGTVSERPQECPGPAPLTAPVPALPPRGTGRESVPGTVTLTGHQAVEEMKRAATAEDWLHAVIGVVSVVLSLLLLAYVVNL